MQGNLLHARLQDCDWHEHSAAVARVTERVAAGACGDIPFSFLCVSASPRLQLQCAQAYTRDQWPPLRAAAAPRRRTKK